MFVLAWSRSTALPLCQLNMLVKKSDSCHCHQAMSCHVCLAVNKYEKLAHTRSNAAPGRFAEGFSWGDVYDAKNTDHISGPDRLFNTGSFMDKFHGTVSWEFFKTREGLPKGCPSVAYMLATLVRCCNNAIWTCLVCRQMIMTADIFTGDNH